jgi:hypothetical protein
MGLVATPPTGMIFVIAPELVELDFLFLCLLKSKREITKRRAADTPGINKILRVLASDDSLGLQSVRMSLYSPFSKYALHLLDVTSEYKLYAPSGNMSRPAMKSRATLELQFPGEQTRAFWQAATSERVE